MKKKAITIVENNGRDDDNWQHANSAWIIKDGSIILSLNVLSLNSKLRVREPNPAVAPEA